MNSRLSADQRREQILEQGALVFANEGFAGAKTRSIADACGISEAVIYQHFKSKAELFEAALTRKVEAHDIEGFLEGLPDDLPILETFKRIALCVLEVGLEDPIVHRLLLAATVAGPTRTRTQYVTWRLPFITHLHSVIQAGIGRGELCEVNPLLTARAFVGLVMDCVLSCNLWIDIGEPALEPRTLVDNNVTTFVRGLVKVQGT